MLGVGAPCNGRAAARAAKAQLGGAGPDAGRPGPELRLPKWWAALEGNLGPHFDLTRAQTIDGRLTG